ncbi:MAG: aldehyde dehydrogenase family protein, partial [Candidatus Neomarinimicrobiota bacterium]
MSNSKSHVSQPTNEPVRAYGPGSMEREALRAKLKELRSTKIEIPLIIGGREIRTGALEKCIIPHNHQHTLATYHKAGEKEMEMAIEASQEAWRGWSTMPWESRVSLFRRMATLLSGPYRDLLNASAMLNMSKNVFQAEVDSACELIDFFNFNTWYAQEIYEQQPLYSPGGTWNRTEHRPLEGFVFAVTPFNFASIAGNLPSSPALMGNTVVWKPSSNAVYPAYRIMQLFMEAGLPDGVINFAPGPGSLVGDIPTKHRKLAGIHFTGSTATFQRMWRTVGENIDNYDGYPRIVGETGGKNFCLVHESADIDAVVTAMIRGAFEYQGQKCSAISRAYIPTSKWEQFKDRYVTEVASIKIGDVEDFTNLMNAVIGEKEFQNITSYIAWAKASDDAELITGGGYDDSVGFFIEPTTIV